MTDNSRTTDPTSAMRDLRERMVDVENQVRMHRQHGWRPDALRATVEEVTRLKALADGLGATTAAAIEPLRAALGAAISSPLMPNADAADQLLTLAEASLAALPSGMPSGAAPASVPSGAPDEAPLRVLIVEDDRSQAVFAQAILRGAGMRAEVVTDPRQALEALDAQQPDLLLTDLHMPAMSGTALIAQIRQHPRFNRMPVVFLTGDQDPDREVEVLEHGGDDFIVKPVRPRHLIAAVQNRIRRARAFQPARAAAGGPVPERHPVAGLHTRQAVLAEVERAYAESAGGAVMLLEIGNAGALRQRYGYLGLEQLMTDAGKVLATLSGEHASARVSDNAFLFAAIGLPDEAIEGWARKLRDGIDQHGFRIGDDALRLRCNVGIARLADATGTAGLLAAAEAASRQAAANPIGIALHVPQAAHPEQAELLADLREALDDGSLGLAYQPVVAVAGGEQPQFQVLLRLRDRHGNLRSAADLLPLATRAGLLPAVDRAVLQQALQVLGQRHQAGRPLRLFVPQSVNTLLEAGHGDWLAAQIRDSAAEPDSLVLELQLQDALVHQASMRELCQALTGHGVQLCLSQYQHGSESAALLHELPLSHVKLSAAHARQPMAESMRGDLHAAIERAHGAGLKVIGPHVEDPQAAATLWMMGIDYIQGNLVQKADQSPEFDFLHAVL